MEFNGLILEDEGGHGLYRIVRDDSGQYDVGALVIIKVSVINASDVMSLHDWLGTVQKKIGAKGLDVQIIHALQRSKMTLNEFRTADADKLKKIGCIGKKSLPRVLEFQAMLRNGEI